MNSADDFRSGQSLSREPSRQGMKFMVERNHINVLRREVLRRVAESFLHDADFGKSVERIPFVMRPKNTKPSRCCIYKDRAILRFRVMAALGFRLEDEEDDSTPLSVYAEKALEREQPSAPILTVCDTACQGMHSRTVLCDRRVSELYCPSLHRVLSFRCHPAHQGTFLY